MAETKPKTSRPNSVTITRRGADDFMVTLNYNGGRLSRFFETYESAFTHAVGLRNEYDLDGIKVRGVAEEGRHHAA